MSSLTTPVAAAKPPSVSPVATLAGKRILVRAGFDPDILDIVASLLDPDSETNDALKQDLDPPHDPLEG